MDLSSINHLSIIFHPSIHLSKIYLRIYKSVNSPTIYLLIIPSICHLFYLPIIYLSIIYLSIPIYLLSFKQTFWAHPGIITHFCNHSTRKTLSNSTLAYTRASETDHYKLDRKTASKNLNKINQQNQLQSLILYGLLIFLTPKLCFLFSQSSPLIL